VRTEKGTPGIHVSGQTVAVNGKADNANAYAMGAGSLSMGQFVGVSDFDQQGIVQRRRDVQIRPGQQLDTPRRRP
jgi:hypothetical protein